MLFSWIQSPLQGLSDEIEQVVCFLFKTQAWRASLETVASKLFG